VQRLLLDKGSQFSVPRVQPEQAEPALRSLGSRTEGSKLRTTIVLNQMLRNTSVECFSKTRTLKQAA